MLWSWGVWSTSCFLCYSRDKQPYSQSALPAQYHAVRDLAIQRKKQTSSDWQRMLGLRAYFKRKSACMQVFDAVCEGSVRSVLVDKMVNYWRQAFLKSSDWCGCLHFCLCLKASLLNLQIWWHLFPQFHDFRLIDPQFHEFKLIELKLEMHSSPSRLKGVLFSFTLDTASKSVRPYCILQTHDCGAAWHAA